MAGEASGIKFSFSDTWLGRGGNEVSVREAGCRKDSLSMSKAWVSGLDRKVLVKKRCWRGRESKGENWEEKNYLSLVFCSFTVMCPSVVFFVLVLMGFLRLPDSMNWCLSSVLENCLIFSSQSSFSVPTGTRIRPSYSILLVSYIAHIFCF